MKKLTTGILTALFCTAFLATFAQNPSPSNNGGLLTSYSDDTFLVRFDASKTQSYINSVMIDLQCEEVWVSPLTSTRLWHFVGTYPHQLQNGEWVANVAASRDKAKNRAGGGGNSGLNYKVSSGQDNMFGTYSPPQGPQNPNPLNPDDQMDCHGADSSVIIAGENNVTVGIFDTGGAPYYAENHNMHWDFEQSSLDLENYLDHGVEAHDDNGHGNHIMSTAFHLSLIHI